MRTDALVVGLLVAAVVGAATVPALASTGAGAEGVGPAAADAHAGEGVSDAGPVATAPAAPAGGEDGGLHDGSALVTLTINVTTTEGKPVDGATVNVSYEGDLEPNTTETVSNGKALVDVPRGATVRIAVTHPEFVKNTPVTVEDVGPGERVNVTMFLPSVVTVEVNDSSGALKNAEVTLRKQSTGDVAARGRTNGNGVFRTPRIEVGSYFVTVVKDFYRQRTVEARAAYGGTTVEVNTTEASVDVSVRVRDDHFDTPESLSGATVTVLYDGETLKTARTGENGNTVLNLGVNAQYTIRVTRESYGTAERTFVLTEEPRSLRFTIQRQPNLTVSAVNNRVVAGESVLVRVRNAYGEPVEGATVTRNGTEVGTTDSAGELQVPVPERGTYEIGASTDAASSGTVLVQGVQPATSTTTTTTPTPFTTTTSSNPLPGFEFGVAVLALVLVVALGAARRRGRDR